MFATLSRFLTGNPNLDAKEVHLNHPQPDYAEAYSELTRCPVLFDQPRTEIIIDSLLLDAPLAMADQATAAMAEQQCADILKRMGPKEGLVAKVRRILLSSPGSFLPVDEVASHLATSTRTLSRGLQDVGTSYQKILDEVRKEMAIEYLRNSNLPIEEIAALIGYSDPSNFRKAIQSSCSFLHDNKKVHAQSNDGKLYGSLKGLSNQLRRQSLQSASLSCAGIRWPFLYELHLESFDKTCRRLASHG